MTRVMASLQGGEAPSFSPHHRGRFKKLSSLLILVAILSAFYALWGSGGDRRNIGKDEGETAVSVAHYEASPSSSGSDDSSRPMKAHDSRPIQAHSPPRSPKTEETDEDETSSLPLLVLHVGPPKTATSTIQCYAASHLSELAEDDVHFVGWLGTLPERLACIEDGFSLDFNYIWGDCLLKCHCDDEDLWTKFENALEKRRLSNSHGTVLYSYEILYYVKDSCDDFWDRLHTIVDGKWNVRIGYSYRRYHEWLISEYHQNNNAAGHKTEHWPGTKGKAVKILQSFPQFFRRSLERHPERNPSVVKTKWESRYPSMTLVNMHDVGGEDDGKGDFLTKWFCETIPEAKHTCDNLRSGEPSMVKNDSSSKVSEIHLDRIATAAFERGWIDGDKINRREAREEIQARAAKKLNWKTFEEFPLECLTPQETEGFLYDSLKAEHDIVPEFYSSSKGEEELRKGFAELVERKALCGVDVDKVLEGKDGDWERFLKGLKSKKG